jgi:hypothetical protein
MYLCVGVVMAGRAGVCAGGTGVGVGRPHCTQPRLTHQVDQRLVKDILTQEGGY